MTKNVDLMLSYKEHEEILRLCKENRVTPLRGIDLDSHAKEIEIDDYDDDDLLYRIIIDLEGNGHDRLEPYAELIKYDFDMEEWDTIDGDSPSITDMCGNYFLNDECEEILFVVSVTSEPAEEEQSDDWLEEETA